MRHNGTVVVLAMAAIGCTAAAPAMGALGGGGGSCKPTIASLYAAQDLDVGTVEITNTTTELIVRVETTGDWRVETVHLYAGLDPVPRNGGGNVAPGRFPSHTELDPAASVAEARMSLAELEAECGTTLVVAVHVDAVRVVGGLVVQSDSAWAYGTPFGGRQWGWESHATICCEVGCTLTQGYWKNHEDAWPVAGLSLGGTYYTKAELIEILRTPVRGDASLSLAHQLIATELNAVTASVPPSVSVARAAAETWLEHHGRLPCAVHPATEEGGEAVALAALLASYNEGNEGVPHCEDAPEPEIID